MKKIILRSLLIILILFVMIIAWVALIINDLNSVSEGSLINAELRTETVVLVVDIQEGITGEDAPPSAHVDQSTDLIQKVNKVILMADSLQIPVAYIQQQTEHWFVNWATDDVLAKGTPGVAVDGRVAILSDNFITKPKSDAFSNPELDMFLDAVNARRIIITGLDIAGCAGNTSLAALNRGYEVVIVEDAVISETDEKKQKKIIELKDAGALIIQGNQFAGFIGE